MRNPDPQNRWSHPTNLIGVLGFLAMVWGGYITFQRDTAADIQKVRETVFALDTRVAILESQIADLRKK